VKGKNVHRKCIRDNGELQKRELRGGGRFAKRKENNSATHEEKSTAMKKSLGTRIKKHNPKKKRDPNRILTKVKKGEKEHGVGNRAPRPLPVALPVQKHREDRMHHHFRKEKTSAPTFLPTKRRKHLRRKGRNIWKTSLPGTCNFARSRRKKKSHKKTWLYAGGSRGKRGVGNVVTGGSLS